MNSSGSIPNLAATAVALLLLADLLPSFPRAGHGPGLFPGAAAQSAVVYRHRRHRP
ncbi:hypothetical protein [Hymenobacter sp. DG01]|uniref:hypothetical protein n=1 Tax=Hymenobacter sp. DG01 TaxID=2584940 RepID=UPI0015DD7A4A|nr:hypothetical protein [Hymenobacter sp. DG01]